MKHFTGAWRDRSVYLEGTKISPEQSQVVVNHSPDGFSWGYGGSGPSQLALAILMLYLPVEKAQQAYQSFKFDIVAHLPQDDFTLSEEKVHDWIRSNVSENAV